MTESNDEAAVADMVRRVKAILAKHGFSWDNLEVYQVIPDSNQIFEDEET